MENTTVAAFVEIDINIDGKKQSRKMLHLLKQGKTPLIWVLPDKQPDVITNIIKKIAITNNKDTYTVPDAAYAFFAAAFKEKDPVEDITLALAPLKNPTPEQVNKAISDYVLVRKLDEVI